MSIHDIYDEHKRKTGNKFSLKADDLRGDDEYSLNVIVFALLDDKVVIACNEDKSKFYTLNGLVDENESSIRAVERLAYSATQFDIDINNTKILTTRCINNNFYDIWLVKVQFSFEIEKIIENRDDLIFVDRDTFEKMIENNDFLEQIEIGDVDLIFGKKNASKVRPLIRKTNTY